MPQNYGDLVIIHGEPGASKTTTCEHFKANYPNVWMCTISPASRGLCSALEDICDAVGVQSGGGARKMYLAICRAIEGKDGVLLIDEAQGLDFTALEQIRSIHDRTKVGVALVGNEGVYTRMSTGHKARDLDRVHSRVARKVYVRKPTKADVDAILDDRGLKGDCRKKMHELSGRPGALRTVGKLLNRAAEFAFDLGVEMCCEHIDMALEEFQGAPT
jgi:DNA transposition AAA+ family ATPase